MALKKCKECGEEISSSAKVCPKCGKNQQNFFQKHPILTIILVVIIIGIVFGSSGTNDDSKLVSSGNNNAEETIYNIGDVISTDKLEFSVENAGTATSVGSEYFNSQPAEGGIYVTVDFKYKNISSEPLSTWEFPSIKLSDENGTTYTADISASAYYATEMGQDSKILSDLNPGISVTNNDVFEISEEAYNSGTWYIIVNNKTKIQIK